MRPARLLIIDDHEAVREALKGRLGDAPGLEIVGCTGCWKTGLEQAVELEPDVVLLETKRADGEGMEALRCLTEECPFARFVVLTSYPDADEREAAFDMGAASYMLKDIDTSHLVSEIQAAARPGPVS